MWATTNTFIGREETFFHGRGSDCLLKVCRVKQVYECSESDVKEDAQLLYEANFSNACGQNWLFSECIDIAW